MNRRTDLLNEVLEFSICYLAVSKWVRIELRGDDVNSPKKLIEQAENKAWYLLHANVEMGEDKLHGDEGEFVKKSSQLSGHPISPKAIYTVYVVFVRRGT